MRDLAQGSSIEFTSSFELPTFEESFSKNDTITPDQSVNYAGPLYFIVEGRVSHKLSKSDESKPYCSIKGLRQSDRIECAPGSETCKHTFVSVVIPKGRVWNISDSFHHTYKGKLYSNPSGFSQDRLSVERPEDSENLSGVKSKSPRKFNIDGLECTTPSAKKGVAIGDLKKIFKGLINVTLASDQEAFLSAKEEVNSRLALMGSTANGSNPTAADGQKAVLSSTAAGQYQNRTSTKDPSAQIAL